MGHRKTPLKCRLLSGMLVCAFCAMAVPGQTGNTTPQTDKPADQEPDKKDQTVPAQVAPVTIPVTPRMKKSKVEEELISLGDLTIKEDGEQQNILLVRNIGNNPISLSVLVQDDLVSSISNEIPFIADFIRRLPRDSRVMVGYIRNGSLQVRQKFTSDLEKAASSLRIPAGSPTAAPYNPYVEVIEGLKRYESLPSGRRAMLVISDGLDISHGIDSSSSSQSIDLQRAINEAQRHSVAIYGFYAPTAATANGRTFLAADAQGSLDRLADETGGHAYFQGTGTPVSFDPYLRELGAALTRQIAVTYLSTHPKKGYHKVEVKSDRTDINIDYPAGYTRK